MILSESLGNSHISNKVGVKTPQRVQRRRRISTPLIFSSYIADRFFIRRRNMFTLNGLGLGSAVLAAVLSVAPSCMAEVFYVGLASAEFSRTIRESPGVTWEFTIAPGNALEIAGGLFSLKRSAITTVPLVMNIYEEIADAEHLLRSASLPSSEVSVSAFGPVFIPYDNALLLSGGSDGNKYLISLSLDISKSTLRVPETVRYMVSADSQSDVVLLDSQQTVRGTPQNTEFSVQMPEPDSVWLLSLSVCGICVLRRTFWLRVSSS